MGAMKKAAGRRVVREVATSYDAFDVQGRVDRALALLGAKEAARALGVSQGQPSRWRSGRERIGRESLARLLDLDLILGRLLLLMDPIAVDSWLDGSNPFLNGSTPRDVMTIRGALALLPAVEGEEQGAFG